VRAWKRPLVPTSTTSPPLLHMPPASEAWQPRVPGRGCSLLGAFGAGGLAEAEDRTVHTLECFRLPHSRTVANPAKPGPEISCMPRRRQVSGAEEPAGEPAQERCCQIPACGSMGLFVVA
jgi:hypothetical protein